MHSVQFRGLEFAISQAMLFRRLGFLFWFSLCTASLNAQSSATQPTSGIDLTAIDNSVNPCENFFRYACGAWNDSHPIPPQYARWGRFNELADRHQETLHQILEDAAKNQNRSALDQKLGAFYSACMDEVAINKAGGDPIRPTIQKIQEISTKAALAPEVAQLQREGVSVFFRFGSSPDFENSVMAIADVDQGGIGLPDKSYYDRPKDEALRQKYVQHIAKCSNFLYAKSRLGYPGEGCDGD